MEYTLGMTAFDEGSAKVSTWQHTVFIRDKCPCSWQDLNPKFQEASGRKPTLWTARQPVSTE